MLTLHSPAFAEGTTIPKKYAYAGEGQNTSPPLSWEGAPEGTRSFALLVEDPDAPRPDRPGPRPWVHWLLYNVPIGRDRLPEGEPATGTPGVNDFGESGWGGPLPPEGSGAHRYFFHLYALDSDLPLAEGATKEQLLGAMEGHILAETTTFGTYERGEPPRSW